MNAFNPAQLDRAAIRRAFDRAAAGYDAVAVLQREVGARLLERLDFTTLKPARILDAGAGTGFATRALAERYPAAQVVALDLAEGMVARASGERTCGDIEALPFADGTFDLVFSNLALQWLDTPRRAFEEFRRVLKQHGLLIFSTFGPDTLKELRAAWVEVDAAPHVSRFIDMHEIGDALVQATFAEPVIDVERITLTYMNVGGLLHDLKTLGAHNAVAGRSRGLTGKARYAQFTRAYEKHRTDGRLPATWELVYGTAWAPLPLERVVLAQQGEIAPDELRRMLKRERHGD
ncbi:MAG TPA: malonyl-ACP O-methyltransferase BioC [Gammaproteobacteria bacterium]|nr:malonyl-ACP O-methyltransferase BioC [Gammaproteobacteria bacterium]